MEKHTIALTADIVSAYISKNAVPKSDLPALIASVATTLAGLSTPPEPIRLEPRIPIKNTITHNYLISLEDGKSYKTLKRPLSRAGLTPEDYIKKWGLPPDYPMVSPAYSERRSALAKEFGLGRKSRPRS